VNANSDVVELPADPVAVQIAREVVAEYGAELAPDLVDDAELLVSELVTNAIRHGKPAITLRVRLDAPGIGVEVRDEGPGTPVIAVEGPTRDQPSGRGLRLVSAIASAWGVHHTDNTPGKAVWFTLHPGT
jgi:anti-sigma regulatory factor (Ser/Thr protein kinase)